MSDTKATFEAAIEAAKKLPERPDNETMLKLYSFFKQATDGDVSGPKPGFFDFVGTAKFEAWEKLQGKTSEESMQGYIDQVKRLGGEF